jgi:hypothetical protein
MLLISPSYDSVFLSLSLSLCDSSTFLLLPSSSSPTSQADNLKPNTPTSQADNANQSLQSRKLKISTKYSSESATMSLFATLITEFPSYPKFKKCSLSRLPPTLRLCLSSPHFEFSSSPKFGLSNLTTSTKIRLRLYDFVSLRHNSQSLRLYLSLSSPNFEVLSFPLLSQIQEMLLSSASSKFCNSVSLEFYTLEFPSSLKFKKCCKISLS